MPNVSLIMIIIVIEMKSYYCRQENGPRTRGFNIV